MTAAYLHLTLPLGLTMCAHQTVPRSWGIQRQKHKQIKALSISSRKGQTPLEYPERLADDDNNINTPLP